MPRWMWFLPIVTVTVLAGLWAFRMGWAVASITESDVINIYAQQYLEAEGPGARPSDCSARPGRAPGVWMVVTCEADTARRYSYAVNRLGRLVTQDGERLPAERPET